MNRYNRMNGSYVYDLIKHQGKRGQHLGTNRKVIETERKVSVRHFILYMWRDQIPRTHNMLYLLHRQLGGAHEYT